LVLLDYFMLGDAALRHFGTAVLRLLNF
jgi:hypothetical protein